MKKKIALLAALMMLIAGVVSASSINGDYKGNPIVKITSNGVPLELDEVPPMIYDGHTVVPISLLRQLGASVTWDPTTYGVDVKLPVAQPKDLSQVIIGFNDKAKDYNAGNVQLIFNKLGGYVSADLNFTGNNDKDTQNALLTSSFVANSPVYQMFIHVYQNNTVTGFYDIRRENAESYINSELTTQEYLNTWIWNPVPTNGSSGTGYSSEIPKIDNSALCIDIIQQYELDKQNTIVLHNRRGGLYSGGLVQDLKILEDNKNKQLSSLGCQKQ